MEKSGWEKFVRDNALGNSEFLTFIHKGKMCFTVNIYNQNGKEMIQPPQSAAFLASSSRVKTEQREDVKKEEVVVSSELSNRGPTTTAESNGRGTNLGKKKAEESQNSKRGEKVVSSRKCFLGASSSSSVAEFTILLKKSYFIYLRSQVDFAKDHMSKEKIMFKIHHPNGKKSWNVLYVVGNEPMLSAGWRRYSREYPLKVGDTCKLTLIKPDELIFVVSKPSEETH